MIRLPDFSTCLCAALLLTLPLLAGTAAKDSTVSDSSQVHSAEAIPLKGVLNEQETTFYRSDTYPLSLAQRGRLATTAYRGLPPGAIGFNYAGNLLDNPVTGFWNEQWLPTYQIEGRGQSPANVALLEPPVPHSPKPLTRIVFSQDYQLGLALIDINYGQRLSSTSYLQLSGSNFLGDGSDGPGFSNFNVNTYRAQLHLRLGKRWNTDFFYWQMRHRFNMPPQDGFNRDKFKAVADLAWVRLSGRTAWGDSLTLTPGYTTVKDEFKRGVPKLRDNRYRIAHLDFSYRHPSLGGVLGVEAGGRYYRNQGAQFWPESDAWDGRLSLLYSAGEGATSLTLRGGGYYHNEDGWRGLGSARWRVALGSVAEVGMSASLRPRPAPLLWKSFTHDSLPAYNSRDLMEDQTAGLLLRFSPAGSFFLQVEPFAARTRHYPLLISGEKQWRQRTVENYGLRVLSALDVWRFQIENDFTYNHKYRSAFAPQINNISTVRTSLRMFNNALKLDGIFNWHYLGFLRTVEFDRLLNHYRLTETETGPFYIADFRLQAQFRNATVFFVWENFLSSDYLIVNDTLESFRIFRLGLDWLLFD